MKYKNIVCSLFKYWGRAGRIKMFAAKPDHLSWSPKTHMIEEENKLSSELLTHAMSHKYTHTHTNILEEVLVCSPVPSLSSSRDPLLLFYFARDRTSGSPGWPL